MKPDLILTWPYFCDFPKFRAMVNEFEDEFGRVIAVVSKNVESGTNHIPWLRGNVPNIEFHEAEPYGGDWRNDAVNTGLDLSTSEWVLFTEPDFFPTRFGLHVVIESGETAGVRCDTGRWHPCFLLAPRADIDLTSRDFGSDEEFDHFGRFSKELDEYVEVVDVTGDWFKHMQGLAEAHSHISRGWPVTYEVERFADYLRECLGLGLSLPPEWEDTTRRWLDNHGV